MYCKQRNLYCRYKYMPQRYRLYVSKIQIICFKNTNSILQIHNLYVVHAEFLCWKSTHCLCLRQRFLCMIYTKSLFLCYIYTESVLSKLGASKCAPAGAFFPAKIHLLYFIHREALFLCLRYIKHVLSKLGVSKCAPAGAFFPAKLHLLYFINREPLFLCLRYIQTQLLGSKVAFRVHETLVWNTPADLPESPESTGNGVVNCRPDPPFHTRRGSG